jgi:hypothetical protein
MDLKQIIEFLGRQQAPADEMTGAFLEDAIAGFASNPAGATRSIRELQANDPSGFLLAAVRLLTSTEGSSPGMQYVAGLMFAGDVLIDPLMDAKILTLDSAKALARNLVTAEPLLDVRMITRMMSHAGGDIRAVDVETALRVLAIAESISDCSRLSFHLVQLLRHPSPRLRSKVALLIGRANLNLYRMRSLLASDDARSRANAIQSLWGSRDPKILTLFEESTKDQNHRVSINALVGLSMAGEATAIDRLKRFASASNSTMRAGAAWAMGALRNACFEETLQNLSLDPEEQVRSMALRSIAQLLPPEAPPADSEDTTDEGERLVH